MGLRKESCDGIIWFCPLNCLAPCSYQPLYQDMSQLLFSLFVSISHHTETRPLTTPKTESYIRKLNVTHAMNIQLLDLHLMFLLLHQSIKRLAPKRNIRINTKKGFRLVCLQPVANIQFGNGSTDKMFFSGRSCIFRHSIQFSQSSITSSQLPSWSIFLRMNLVTNRTTFLLLSVSNSLHPECLNLLLAKMLPFTA